MLRKKTNTNVLLNFNAITPIKWKSSIILCLLNRAWIICSDASLFKTELEKLRSIFASNGYPHNLFNKVLHRFITTQLISVSSKLNESTYNDNDSRFVLKLPFLGKASKDFGKKTFEIDFDQVSRAGKCRV